MAKGCLKKHALTVQVFAIFNWSKISWVLWIEYFFCRKSWPSLSIENIFFGGFVKKKFRQTAFCARLWLVLRDQHLLAFLYLVFKKKAFAKENLSLLRKNVYLSLFRLPPFTYLPTTSWTIKVQESPWNTNQN